MNASVFHREAGSGPGVVCIHSNASSGSQWRSLMELLSPRFHVLAPDSYGAGKSPEWPVEDRITLADEVRLIEPVLDRAPPPLTLVGHSYGGAVALKAALMHPARVKALVLYEPTLFAVIEQEGPSPNEADGIRDAVARAGVSLDAGNKDGAAEAFIDYWMGAGSWARTPEARKPAIADAVTKVRRWKHALFTEPTPIEAFRKLEVPVLLMTGKRSTASAHGVARILKVALPRVEHVEFEELGHMGPITHPDAVNGAIARFLSR